MIKQTLSPEQAAYVDAKIAYQETTALMQAFSDLLPWDAVGENDAAIDALCLLVENKDQELGHSLRAKALQQAGISLIVWGINHAKLHASKSQAKILDELYSKALKAGLLGRHKEKLISLCLRLQA